MLLSSWTIIFGKKTNPTFFRSQSWPSAAWGGERWVRKIAINADVDCCLFCCWVCYSCWCRCCCCWCRCYCSCCWCCCFCLGLWSLMHLLDQTRYEREKGNMRWVNSLRMAGKPVWKEVDNKLKRRHCEPWGLSWNKWGFVTFRAIENTMNRCLQKHLRNVQRGLQFIIELFGFVWHYTQKAD